MPASLSPLNEVNLSPEPIRYVRTTRLPPLEAKFENFYVRYSVLPENSAIEAEVWDAYDWTEDGRPVFYLNIGTGDEESNPEKVEPLCSLRVGFDGCSHLRLPYLHFDTLDEFESFGRCVRFIFDDLCEKHDVTD